MTCDSKQDFQSASASGDQAVLKDVDCVLTTTELLQMIESRVGLARFTSNDEDDDYVCNGPGTVHT